MKAYRPEKRLEREEYLSRARSMAPRGQDLPQTKLLDLDIVSSEAPQNNAKTCESTSETT